MLWLPVLVFLPYGWGVKALGGRLLARRLLGGKAPTSRRVPTGRLL